MKIKWKKTVKTLIDWLRMDWLLMAAPTHCIVQCICLQIALNVANPFRIPETKTTGHVMHQHLILTRCIFFSFHFFQPLHFDHYRSVNHHFMIFIPILMCGICLIGLSSLRWTCGNSTVFEEVKYFKNIFHNIVILFSFGFDQRVESWVG